MCVRRRREGGEKEERKEKEKKREERSRKRGHTLPSPCELTASRYTINMPLVGTHAEVKTTRAASILKAVPALSLPPSETVCSLMRCANPVGRAL